MKKTIDDISLDGGIACFDFTNTVSHRKESEADDYLVNYGEWLRWCSRVALMEPERIEKLKALAIQNTSVAQKVLGEVIQIRESLYQVFSALAKNKKPEGKALRHVNDMVSEALSQLQFSFVNGEKKITWRTDKPDLKEPLWRILKSAYDLWAFNDIDRIKECPRCGWLFLDTSKNKRRRWCNMQDCGSSDKALRYYYRKKKEKK